MSWPINTIIGRCDGTSNEKLETSDYRGSQLNKTAGYVTGISKPSEFNPDVGDSTYYLGCPIHRMVISKEERYTKQGVRMCGFLPQEGDIIASEEEGGEDVVVSPNEDPCANLGPETVYMKKVVVKEGTYFGKHITTFTYRRGDDGTGCEIDEELDNEGYCAGGTVDPDEPPPEPDPDTGITPPPTEYNKVTTTTTVNGSTSYSYPPGGCGGNFSYPGESYSAQYQSETVTVAYSCFGENTSTSSGSSSWTEGISYCDGESYTSTCSSTMTDGVWTADYGGGSTGTGSCTNSFGEVEVTKSYADPIPYNPGSVTLSNPNPGFGPDDWQEWSDPDEGGSLSIVVQNKISLSGGYQSRGKYGHYVQRCNIGEKYTLLLLKTTGPTIGIDLNCFSGSGDTEECWDYTYETLTFTATKPVHFFDCSLDGSVSENLFINHNYSTSPASYSLGSDAIIVGSPEEELAVPEENSCLRLELIRDVNADRTFLLNESE